MTDFKKVAQRLNLNFKHIELLKEALTHRSFLNEHKDWPFPCNERLEFLGDAVLELILSDYLIQHFPSQREGKLTLMRAALARTETLRDVALKLHLDKYLLLSRGEKKLLSKDSALLADAVEALIGALYLDQGIEAARKFVTEHILCKVDSFLKKKTIKDPKSLLQEKSQEILGITPHYEVLSDWGPDHAKHFKAGVYLGSELLATGEGTSKQEAETEAAKKALEEKNWE